MQGCLFPAEPCVLVRLDIWEKGNISLLQLSEKLRGALRHALCDAVMEFLVLPAPLCLEAACPLAATDVEELSSAGESGMGWDGTGTPSPPPALFVLPVGAQLVLGGDLGRGGKKPLSPLPAVLCDVPGEKQHKNRVGRDL